METQVYKYPPNLMLPLERGKKYITNLGKTVQITYIAPGGIAEVCINGKYHMTAWAHSGSDFHACYEKNCRRAY